MATVKNRPTVAIVNPKDPKDPKPRFANIEDVQKRGWTLWADRHDPDRLADVEKAEARKRAAAEEAAKEMSYKVEDPKPVEGTDEKPAEGEDAPKGSAVDPSQVKKSPAKKS